MTEQLCTLSTGSPAICKYSNVYLCTVPENDPCPYKVSRTIYNYRVTVDITTRESTSIVDIENRVNNYFSFEDQSINRIKVEPI